MEKIWNYVLKNDFKKVVETYEEGDKDNENVIEFAARRGNLKMTEWLCNQYDATPYYSDFAALRAAAMEGHLEVFSFLFKYSNENLNNYHLRYLNSTVFSDCLFSAKRNNRGCIVAFLEKQ